MNKAYIVDILDKVLLALFTLSWLVWIFYPTLLWGVISMVTTGGAFYFVHWRSRYWAQDVTRMLYKG